MSESFDRSGRFGPLTRAPAQEARAPSTQGAGGDGQQRAGDWTGRPATYQTAHPPAHHTGAQQPTPTGTYQRAPVDDPASFSAPVVTGDPDSRGAGRQPEMYAPARQQPAARSSSATHPIVPAGSVTGRSLTLVIAIMCFLACLTAGAVYLINQAAASWLRDVASEISVQVEPKGSAAETDKRVADVAAFILKQPGVRDVKSLSHKDSAQLLEPWLGKTDGLANLPVPRLIAIELDRVAPADLDRLREALKKQFAAGTTLDDHRHWQTQIKTVTRTFALGGLAILVLVGAATTAIIISATKSSMASNKDIVEVLNFVGATDRFIAREFEKHFLRLGIRAGMVGAGLAMLVFLTMPTAMQMLGGGAVTQAELARLVGTGALDIPGYFLLGIVVVVTAALCMLTSRYGVYRILNTRH